MFKIRMQGQYGRGGKRLSTVVGDMWREWGFRTGVMRGYGVGFALYGLCDPRELNEVLGHGHSRDPGIRRFLLRSVIPLSPLLLKSSYDISLLLYQPVSLTRQRV